MTSSPSFFFSPPIPLCLPLPGLIFIITCAPAHIILRCSYWMFTEGQMYAFWVNVLMLELIILCVCVFRMRTWSNLCKMMPFLCSFAENTEQIGTCVQTGEMCSKFWETCLCFENCMNALENWVKLISYSVVAIEKNCNNM